MVEPMADLHPNQVPGFLPTPEEIKDQCLKIRSQWEKDKSYAVDDRKLNLGVEGPAIREIVVQPDCRRGTLLKKLTEEGYEEDNYGVEYARNHNQVQLCHYPGYLY